MVGLEGWALQKGITLDCQSPFLNLCNTDCATLIMVHCKRTLSQTVSPSHCNIGLLSSSSRKICVFYGFMVMHCFELGGGVTDRAKEGERSPRAQTQECRIQTPLLYSLLKKANTN